MFKILEKYISYLILKINIVILFILITLSSIVKFIEQLKQVGNGKYFIYSAILYTIMSIPKDFQVFTPISIMISTMIGLLLLINKNELIIMQTSGFSRSKIIFSIIKITFILVLFSIFFCEFITPYTEQLAKNYRTKMMYGDSIVSIKYGIWIKDKNNFIFIKKILEKNKLIGIKIYNLNKKNKLSYIYNSVSAEVNGKIWNLSNVIKIKFDNKKKILYKKFFNKKFKTSITSKKLNIIFIKPEFLSIYKLYKYINFLKKIEQNNIKYKLIMWNKILYPFFIFSIVLMDIFFILGSIFSNIKIHIRIFIGIIFGFIFYVITNLTESIMLLNNIPPIFGAVFYIFFIIFIIFFLF